MKQSRGVIAKLNAAVITEGPPEQIDCAMCFNEDKPYEVVFVSTQRTEDGLPVEWHYARSLLSQGLKGDEEEVYGEGDVQVFREKHFFFTVFTSKEGKALIAFAEDDMRCFLNATEKIVPLDAEDIHAEVDAAIAAILSLDEQ